MPHWKTYVQKNSKHLTWCDLDGKSPLKVTIDNHEMDEVYNPDEHEKGEMLFIGFKLGDKQLGKKLGLNVTNGHIIEKVTGETDPDNWAGKEITLRIAELARDDERCVRVDVPKGTKIPGRYPKFTYID